MAKLALLFIAVFCIFSIAIASRIPRDTEPVNDIAKQMERAWQAFTKQVEEHLSKENVEKIAAQMKEVGEKITAAGKDLVGKIEENTKQS